MPFRFTRVHLNLRLSEPEPDLEVYTIVPVIHS